MCSSTRRTGRPPRSRCWRRRCVIRRRWNWPTTPRTANSPDAPVLEILKARTLYSLGEKDKAKAIFARYGGQIKGTAGASWPETLIDAEMRVGLKDQAAEHAALVLATSRDQGWPERLFPKLFPKNGRDGRDAVDDPGGACRTRRRPTLRRAEVMKKLRGLLDGTADARRHSRTWCNGWRSSGNRVSHLTNRRAPRPRRSRPGCEG